MNMWLFGNYAVDAAVLDKSLLNLNEILHGSIKKTYHWT